MLMFVDEMRGREFPLRPAEQTCAALLKLGIAHERAELLPDVRADLWAMSADEVRATLAALIASSAPSDKPGGERS